MGIPAGNMNSYGNDPWNSIGNSEWLQYANSDGNSMVSSKTSFLYKICGLYKFKVVKNKLI